MSCDLKFNCGCRREPYYVHTSTNCIDLAWICDGFPDCDDGSDEIDCICSENEYQCRNCRRGVICRDEILFQTTVVYYEFYTFYCILDTKILDEKVDCLNKRDER